MRQCNKLDAVAGGICRSHTLVSLNSRQGMIIAPVLTRLLRAGSEENTILTCLDQARKGHDVYLVHGNEFRAAYYEELQPHLKLVEVRSLVHPISPHRDLQAIFDLRRLFRTIRADVVHTHQSKAGVLGRFAAAAAGVPTVIHGVHIVPFESVGPLKKWIYVSAERLAARHTGAFINVSRGTMEAHLQERIGDPARHHVVHSGMDLRRFAQPTLLPAAEQEAILGAPRDAVKVVVMIAALEARKRHREFLQAFPRVVEKVPNVRLLLAGDGELRGEVEALVARLGLQEQVRILGYHTNPGGLIALADLCLLTSTREGLPRVVIQYLAAGRPVVVSDLPGLDEVVKHGRNGVIVPPDDVAAAGDEVARLLADEPALAALRRGAEATDVSSWSAEKMVADIERIYRAVQT